MTRQRKFPYPAKFSRHVPRNRNLQAAQVEVLTQLVDVLGLHGLQGEAFWRTLAIRLCENEIPAFSHRLGEKLGPERKVQNSMRLYVMVNNVAEVLAGRPNPQRPTIPGSGNSEKADLVDKVAASMKSDGDRIGITGILRKLTQTKGWEWHKKDVETLRDHYYQAKKEIEALRQELRAAVESINNSQSRTTSLIESSGQ